jgi:hypothetical protein
MRGITRRSHPSSLARGLQPARRPLFPFVALLIAGSVALTACGGGSSTATSTTTTAGSGAGQAKASLAAYTSCLAKHGVKLPNFGGTRGTFPTGGSFPPTGGGRSQFNSPAFRKASSACASLRPKGGFGNRPGGGGGGGGFSSAALAAYRNCLKIHGVTLPSRSSSTSSTPPATLNTKSPAVKKALDACASLRPKFTPRSSGSTTTTTS